ncbi:MAG TPA: type IX secretion system protein PorQ [Chitinophagaceae bacterium]|nr:type IX secretion system protein PorQ [Chitinophagaceae bacterium]
MRFPLTILFLALFCQLSAQTLGGNAVFNFLQLSPTPQLTALGGINVSQPSHDIGLAFNNPALLKPTMHAQVNTVFNGFYGGVNAYQLSGGWHHEKLNTTFFGGIHYLSYGKITETDASGNILGQLNPTDWVVQLAASRSYREKWNFGLTLKYIQSNYGLYRSNGIAMDAGLLYHDSSKLFSASLLARNMGFQVKEYAGTDPGDLPFDLQIGLTKKLADAPFSFSVTAHHLHQFDIRYNDTLFNNENGFDNGSLKKFSFDKLFRHFVFATTIHLGDKVEVQAGYNHLRRKELNIGNAGNGLTGFSLGVGVLLNKLDIRYARSHYQNNTGYNQFGLNIKLDQYFRLGKARGKTGG